MHGPRALSDLKRALDGLQSDPAVHGDLLLVAVALAHHCASTPGPWRLEDAAVGWFPGDRAAAAHGARTALAGDVVRLVGGHPTGGALTRHFPQLDWPRVWAELDPWSVRPVDGAVPAGVRLHIDTHDDEDEPAGPGLRLVQ